MVLGVTFMKYWLIPLLLTACTISTASQDIQIFDTTVKVDKNCHIEFRYKDKTQTHTYPFDKNGACELVKHAGTNIAHTQFIRGMYVLFVENNIKKEDQCFSEYSAFGISRKNTVHVTDRIKRSGSCHQDKEAQSFEYFSALLKPIIADY
jgi:hypothetical protein